MHISEFISRLSKVSFEAGYAEACWLEGVAMDVAYLDEKNKAVELAALEFEKTWTVIKKLARKEVEQGGWCPICETTLGNGSEIHSDDCPLWEADDK